jgi:tetratricopeptide (TPR) repeat protein
MKITLHIIVAAAIGLSCAWAQRGGGSTGGASGGAAGGTAAPSNPTGPSTGTGTGNPGSGRGTVTGPTNPTQQNQTQAAPAPRPIFISGTVSTDDGSPLPGSMKIQAVCGADQRIVAHTGQQGDFSFLWGQNSGIFEDASQSGSSSVFGPSSGGSGGMSGAASSMGVGLANPLSNCELRVDAAGYLSSHAPLLSYGQLDRIEVGTLIIHRVTGEEGTTVSVLSMKAPKDAKKDFKKGADQFRQRKFKDAETSFRKAVTEYPDYADAWLSLGRTERQLGAHEAAHEDFQKAMDLDKKLLGPWQELGYLAADQSKWEDAAKYLDQATRLDPMNSAVPWFFSAVADFNLQRYEAAERSIRAEVRLDQDKNPRAKYLLGLILLARNDMTGAAEALRGFLKVAPAGPDAEMAKKQLLRAESLAAK